MLQQSIHIKVNLSLILIFQAFISVAQNFNIKGKVKNGIENLPGATVSIGNKTILSDNNGEFTFMVNPGQHILTITHTGYKNIQERITVTGQAVYLIYNLAPATEIGEVVVLGSRASSKQTEFNSPIPVRVYSSSQLVQTGQVSMSQMLTYTAPSFNTSREILNEPSTLRGLDPQHVLLMLNGIRYHNMAWLYSGGLKGQLGRGSVGNDLNSIPFSAVDKVEILSDGASAQYGSDAIAGVINVLLKRNVGKTSIELHKGQIRR